MGSKLATYACGTHAAVFSAGELTCWFAMSGAAANAKNQGSLHLNMRPPRALSDSRLILIIRNAEPDWLIEGMREFPVFQTKNGFIPANFY
jgi:hypothetical protein